MANAGIHFSGEEQPSAKLTTLASANAPKDYSYVVVNLSDEVTFYLPMGEKGVSLARALAAVLLTAAEEQEAWLAEAPYEGLPVLGHSEPIVLDDAASAAHEVR